MGLAILLHFEVDGSAPLVGDGGIGFIGVFVDAQEANVVILEKRVEFGEIGGIFKGT